MRDTGAMRRAAIAVVTALGLAAPRVARADGWLELARQATGLWTESQESEVRQRLDEARLLASLYAANTEVLEQRLDVTGALGLGTERAAAQADLVVGASYTARGERCDILQVGASARAGLDVGAPSTTSSAQHWAELCLDPGISSATLDPELRGLFLFPLRLREGVAINATPRLTAPRASFDERYSEAGFGFAVEGLRYEWRPDHGVALPGFSADERWRWRGLPGGDDARFELSGEMYFVRLYHHRGARAPSDRQVDVFAIAFHGIQADNGAAIIDFMPVRLTGFGLGQEHVLVDLSVGVAGTGELSSSTSGPGVDNMETIGTTGLPDVTRASVHAAIYGGAAARAFAVAYDRGVDTNLFADVIVEDRGSAWLRYPLGAGGRARAALFVARATYFLDEDVVAGERVVGISADAEVPLGRGLRLGFSLDAALGLAALDPALDGHAPGRGVRGLVELRATRTPWQRVAAPAAEPPAD